MMPPLLWRRGWGKELCPARSQDIWVQVGVSRSLWDCGQLLSPPGPHRQEEHSSWQWFSAWATCWNYLGSLVLREIRSELQGLGDSARLCEELRTVLINSPGWASLPHSVLRSWWDSRGEPWSCNRCQKWGKKRRLDYSAQPHLPIRHQ